jgi:hypothetical protein
MTKTIIRPKMFIERLRNIVFLLLEKCGEQSDKEPRNYLTIMSGITSSPILVPAVMRREWGLYKPL